MTNVFDLHLHLISDLDQDQHNFLLKRSISNFHVYRITNSFYIKRSSTMNLLALHSKSQILTFSLTHSRHNVLLFTFFCCNAALRTTRGSLSVCLYVCMSLLAFLPFTQKIFKQPIPQNLWSYAIFFCGCPYEKKNFKNLVYEGVQHFLDTRYKISFLL